jgi:hypothetical protein
MNPVEIDEAVSALALEPFDRAEFPFQFLRAFGNKETAIARLKAGNTNQSDVPGAVLQRGNIHIATCAPGEVDATLAALRGSAKTASQKAKFILATDGIEFQAEDMNGGGTVACAYADFGERFSFFLPLAGITTVEQIRESAFDIKATGRLNKLYVELLKDNPDWASADRRHDMNHFMARLIFCFFAEDTDIFVGEGLFSKTIEQMSARDSSDTHLVMAEVFRAMDTRLADRKAAGIRAYADVFPYVNGQLFSGSTECPRFSRIARSYLLHIGSLDWQKINPDIFGSMIQAVADDEERGALGMHYTSVPNILKVLNPLFLDDLRAKLEEAGDNARKLLNLRQRMAKIRVFDPACGSGNFLVIAYKQMRELEAEINRRRGEPDRRSDIPLTNFRGIELRDFPAEIARLALIIAEYQCDVLYRGQKEALAEFLPLDSQNWITCGNALRLDWLSICPPTGTGVRVQANDLFETPLDQAEIDFENEGGETYICGNPPYKGNARKSAEQKDDLAKVLGSFEKWGLLDYVCGWFVKAFEFSKSSPAKFAFVATNSVAQGQHVSNFWKPLFSEGLRFFFAVRSFKWANLAANDAGVTVVVIGGSLDSGTATLIDELTQVECDNINGYLLPQPNYWVLAANKPASELPSMIKGNYYGLSDHLLMDRETAAAMINEGLPTGYIRKFYGSAEVINGRPRRSLWFPDAPSSEIIELSDIRERLDQGSQTRSKSKDALANGMVKRPHQFREMNSAQHHTIAVPVVSSENRGFLPTDIIDNTAVISNKCFGLFDAPLWAMSLVASRLHWVWVGAVCVRLEMRFSYSNTLGWNTFPLPTLTEQNKTDLTRCAEDILLAREAHFPATIADLYDPEAMPEDLRAAHDRNDEVLERIYIGRRFRNDTERLEKLFELYTKMTAKTGKGKAA